MDGLGGRLGLLPPRLDIVVAAPVDSVIAIASVGATLAADRAAAAGAVPSMRSMLLAGQHVIGQHGGGVSCHACQ
jgi:hypothetical protein